MSLIININKIALILLIATWHGACQNSGKPSAVSQTKTIIVYGSDNCHHCVDFKAELDSVGLNYEFRDVELNNAYNNELFYKVQAARIVGQVNYPVVDIEGKILVTPDIKEVIALM